MKDLTIDNPPIALARLVWAIWRLRLGGVTQGRVSHR